MVVYWLFRLTILLTSPLPLWLGYRVAAFVADICYLFFRRQRNGLNRNMAVVLGTDDQREMDATARRAFRNFGKFCIDFIHFPAMTRDEVRTRLAFSQWNDLDDAVASGRGVLITTMHFGVWDLGAAALAAYDYPINAIVDRFDDAKLDALVRSSRKDLGMKVIPADHVGPGVFRALKRGEMLAMVMDVPPEDHVITVDFLGSPAQVSSVPARIALRTGALVVPALVLRGPQHDSIIRPVMDFRSARYEPTDDEERDVLELTTLIMRALEPIVREHPEQWYLFHPLWPQGDEPVVRTVLTGAR